MTNVFPESPDRPFQDSVADRIGHQQQNLAITPSDPMRFAMSPETNPPVPSAPDAAQLWPSGSGASVGAVASAARSATDVAAGATALTCGTAAG